MTALSSLKTDASIADETDVLGGGGPLDSDAYRTKITMAYLSKSQGGALSLVLHLATETGSTIRQTLWMTSGDAKGNKNFYSTKTGEKKYLPGFNLANSLALLTVAKEISEIEPQQKVINVYNYDTKADIATEMPVLVDLIDQEIVAGTMRQVVDKQAKGDDGAYHPTGETREENEVVKFFRARDLMTVTEIRAQAEAPEFYNSWVAKYKGVTRDLTSKDTNVTTGNFAAKTGNAAAPAPKAQSIFS